MTQTIAIFSTYLPSEGFGGPARIHHARTALEAAGHRVLHVVLQAGHDARTPRSDDFVRTIVRPFRAPIDHIYHDVDLGQRAGADQRLVRDLIDHLRRSGTSLIIMEQPFLIDVVEVAASALGVPVIYSSQNVEYRLRRDLERFQNDWRRPTNRAAIVREIEQRAVDLADAVTTICETDRAETLAEFGRDSTLVPNGSTVADIDISVPASGLMTNDVVDFAYAGSSYWPNIEGFAQIATPSLAFLPPGTAIHVAGSVSGEIFQFPSVARWHSANASRIIRRGFLPMNDLVDMMRRSRAVLVPVFIGEGSNLKTADALASGAPVIMTRRATRGYELVIAADDEGVSIVDDPVGFRVAMAAHLNAPRPTEPVGGVRRELLVWGRRLQPLVDLVDSTVDH